MANGGQKRVPTGTRGEAPSTRFLLVEGVPAGAPGRIRTGATGSGDLDALAPEPLGGLFGARAKYGDLAGSPTSKLLGVFAGQAPRMAQRHNVEVAGSNHG
jgi:hypothetical protein